MRLWIAMTLAAVGLAAGAWWLTRSPLPERPSAAVAPVLAVARSTEPNPPPQPTEFSAPANGRRFRIPPAANEPIHVYSYSETESSVEPAPAPPMPVVAVNDTPDRLVPRPESGIEPLPWMPYAEEDAELARDRREARDRLAKGQTAEPPLFRELQETAEPPLNLPDRPALSWRPHGKLPCSVK